MPVWQFVSAEGYDIGTGRACMTCQLHSHLDSYQTLSLMLQMLISRLAIHRLLCSMQPTLLVGIAMCQSSPSNAPTKRFQWHGAGIVLLLHVKTQTVCYIIFEMALPQVTCKS